MIKVKFDHDGSWKVFTDLDWFEHSAFGHVLLQILCYQPCHGSSVRILGCWLSLALAGFRWSRARGSRGAESACLVSLGGTNNALGQPMCKKHGKMQ